jgi:hypothetical protein
MTQSADPWAEFRTPPAASQPRAIEGPPRLPNLPPGQTPEQEEGVRLANDLARLNIEKQQREAREAAERAARSQSELRDVRGEMAAVIEAARRAQQRSRDGWFMTGIGSDWIGGNTPEGRSLRGDLDVIGSNAAFTRLQQMRSESPTGGALGSITERELQLLQNTVASLDPGQSDADFQRNMQTIIDRYQGILSRLPADEARDRAQQQSQAPAARQTGDIAFWDEARPPEPPPSQGAPQDPRLAGEAQAMFERGASRAQLDAWARQNGLEPFGGELDQAIQYRDRGGQGARITPFVAQPVAATPEERETNYELSVTPFPGGPSLSLGTQDVDAAMRGAADTLSLGLSDEISAAGDTIFGRGGTYAENLYRQRGIDQYDQQNNFGPRLTGQLSAGLALPTFGARSVPQLAGVGAGYGGAYGFGSGEGGFVDRSGNALVGATIGGATGLAGGTLGNWLNRRVTQGAEARDLVEAADRQGVPVMPADVGGPVTRRLTAGMAQTLGGGGQVIRAAQRTSQAAGEARDRIAGRVGQVMDPENAGVAARRGAQSYISRTSGRASQLYGRAERAAGDSRITPVRAWEVLDQNIAELGETPGGTEGLGALQALRQELNGTFTVAGMRRMRTALRDRFISSGLRGSDIERRVNQVIDAAGDDVVNGLIAQDRGVAARAYQQADRYWRERLQTIDKVLEPFIGNGQSGEQIVRSLQTAAKGNTEQLSRFIRALPAEEASTVRATLISQLGRPTAGTNAGEAFSLNQFLTHWNAMTPRARQVVFGGDSLSALDDLARVAKGSRQAQAYLNRSNTGGAVGSILTAGILGLPAVAAALGTSNAAGRLMASPAFARWLAGAGRTRNPRLHVQGLTTVAARNPAIAQDVLGLQRTLLNAANDNHLTRAAASPDEGQGNDQ